MTNLRERKTKCVFETADEVREKGRNRTIIIEAHPLYAKIRTKGMQRSINISWSAIYGAAWRMEAERKKSERKAKRRMIEKVVKAVIKNTEPPPMMYIPG